MFEIHWWCFRNVISMKNIYVKTLVDFAQIQHWSGVSGKIIQVYFFGYLDDSEKV